MQCLKRLVEEERADEVKVVSLWKHEMERLYRDTLCRHNDMLWFDDQISSTINEVRTHNIVCLLISISYNVSFAFRSGLTC